VQQFVATLLYTILEVYMSNFNFPENFNKLFIGTNLRRLRESLKLTPLEISKIIGKSRQGYVHYERGEREISIKDLITLSGFYNVSLDVIVSNPFSLRNDNILMFRSFEKDEHCVKEVMPFTLSTVHDDVICYKKDEKTIQFFWKTIRNADDHVMLFDYYDKTYISKVYFKNTGGGHFYINNVPKYFNKVHAENLLFKGVLMGELKKHMQVPTFFNTHSEH
jgi:transcriptional regulator with XRE-family HTH domain